MGLTFIDQYSLLHFSSGVVAYFWGIPPHIWFVLHFGFEVLENTDEGMKFISEQIKFWPGGKPYKDAPINMFGDQVSTMAGWYCAYKLDQVSPNKKR
jgi:hypothetical protein